MLDPCELTTAEMNAVAGGVENAAQVDEISTATPTSGFAFQRVRATSAIFSTTPPTVDGPGFAINNVSLRQPGS
jgi:hypothetical protein